MKAVYILILGLFCNQTHGLCQKISSVELCNGTQSLYYFSSATSAINYFLLKGDVSILNEISFSNRSKLTNEYLLSLFKKSDSVFKRYKLADLPSSSNVKVQLGKGLWHEINYFYLDKKSAKQILVMQLYVLFDGDNAEAEKKAPRVKDINLRLGKAIVDRKAYLKNIKSVEAPPKL